MSHRLPVSSVAVGAILGLSGAAFADDLTPPPWRFNPGTTVQHWDFSSGPTGFTPDALPLNNSFGTPVMTPTSGAVWLPAVNGRNDVWAIAGGGLSFDIPNTGNQAHMKNLWLQVTYFGPAPGGPGYSVAGPSGVFTQVGAPITTALPGGWVHELTQWSVPVCPPFERVSIFPGLAGAQTFVDQVVIDTQCIIPSPGSASLLALGGVCALRRRRRGE